MSLYYFILGKALLGKECRLDTPPPIAPEQWDTLFQIAAVQHTAALISNTLQELPPQMQPPNRNKFLAEQLLCQNASERHNKVLQSLLHTANKGGFKIMVIKGVTLSRHYPTPSLRYSSDIDFFLVGDEEAFLQIIQRELGATHINSQAYHHTTFKIGGTTLECHHDFLGTWSYRKMDELMVGMIKDADDSHKFRGESILLPSPELGALFLLSHAHKSSCARQVINTRGLCDWVATLKECRDTIDWTVVRKNLAENHLEGFLDVYNAIAIKYMGMPQEWVSKLEPRGAEYLADTAMLSAMPRPKGSRFRQYATKHSKSLFFATYLTVTGLVKHYRFTSRFDKSQSFTNYMTTNIAHRVKKVIS